MTKKNIIVITGNEIRHQYFYQKLENDSRLNILGCYAEDASKSLENRIFSNQASSDLQKRHVMMRKQSEIDFLQDYINPDCLKQNNYKVIKKGMINDQLIVNEIVELNPDILVCYGSSLIKENLIKNFKKRFINVHLGLSPYYRGSGTNIWPFINNDLEMVGATYMYIDEGVDTGEIIHQIRAEMYYGDNPHTIGSRFITKMTKVYCEIIANFNNLKNVKQPESKDSKYYYEKNFDETACKKLYSNIENGIVSKFLDHYDKNNFKYIAENPAIEK